MTSSEITIETILEEAFTTDAILSLNRRDEYTGVLKYIDHIHTHILKNMNTAPEVYAYKSFFFRRRNAAKEKELPEYKEILNQLFKYDPIAERFGEIATYRTHVMKKKLKP